MENDLFAASLSAMDQGHMVFNTAPYMHAGVVDHGTHEQIMASSPVPQLAPEEYLNSLYAANSCGMHETPISRSILHAGSGFLEGYGGGDSHVGTSLSVASLSSLLSPNVDQGEGLFNLSYPIPRNQDYRAQDGTVQDEFLKAISTVHPSYHVMGTRLPGSDIYSLPRNELSLSLGSCQPSVLCMPDIADHCSEKSCSVVTQVTPKSSEELSLCFGPSTSVHFSHVLLGSRYLDVAQEVLAQVVDYALGNSEELDDSVSGIEGEVRMSFSSSCSKAKGLSDVGSVEFTSSREIESWEDVEHLMLEENMADKMKLVTMLKMVRYFSIAYMTYIRMIM